jgi:glycosyltransferase involved in cell wall biosynthesis
MKNKYPVELIPNGVSISAPSKKLSFDISTTDRSPLIFGFHGRLVNQKNLSFLIEAFADFSEIAFCRSELWIIGDGNKLEECVELCASLKIADRVRFWGRIEDISEVLTRIDVEIFPSKYEGMPLSLLEAMGFGICCMVSDIRAHQKVFESSGIGTFFPLDKRSVLVNHMLNFAKRSIESIDRERIAMRLLYEKKYTEECSFSEYRRLILDGHV